MITAEKIICDVRLQSQFHDIPLQIIYVIISGTMVHTYSLGMSCKGSHRFL